MRRVERHRTVHLNREPWLSRGTGDRGQTLMTNVKDPVFYHDDEEVAFEIGMFDQMYRLYRHQGLSAKAVSDGEVVRYFRDEYSYLRDNGALWIEFVPPTGTAVRIDANAFRRYGEAAQTPWGPMWVVPLRYYEGNN